VSLETVYPEDSASTYNTISFCSHSI